MFKNCNAMRVVTGGAKVQLMVNMFRLFTLSKRHGSSLMVLEKSKVFLISGVSCSGFLLKILETKEISNCFRKKWCIVLSIVS